MVQLRRHLMYLNRLTEKMLKKNWLLDDPVRDRGIAAQKAIQGALRRGEIERGEAVGLMMRCYGDFAVA